jgi:glycosyltransferase involved in cell wall biosynthesis
MVVHCSRRVCRPRRDGQCAAPSGHVRKGIAELIDVFVLAVRQVPDAHSYLVGNGPDRVSFETQACALGASDHIHFTAIFVGQTFSRWHCRQIRRHWLFQKHGRRAAILSLLMSMAFRRRSTMERRAF